MFQFVLPFYRFAVRIKLTDPLLGTVPKDKAVFGAHKANDIRKGVEAKRKAAAKAGDPEEMIIMPGGLSPATPETAEARAVEETAMIQEESERGWTGFLMKPGTDIPVLSSHMIGGLYSHVAETLKESMLKAIGCGQVKQLKNKVKRYLFVEERFLVLPKPPKGADWDGSNGHPLLIPHESGPVCERPLRAQTPQGERVTVVRSDVVLAGSEIEFTLKLLKGSGIPAKLLQYMLSYGLLQGLGQWRTSKIFGRFEIVRFDEVDAQGNPIDTAGAEEAAAELEAAAAAAKPKRGAKKAAAKAADPVLGDDEEGDGEDE